MAGGEGVRGQKEGAIDLGRHHFGQALCSEDGIGDLSLERQAPARGQRHRPFDPALDGWESADRVYDKPAGGQTKNEHFRAMLKVAKERGFAPEYVLMDSWYSGLENLIS